MKHRKRTSRYNNDIGLSKRVKKITVGVIVLWVASVVLFRAMPPLVTPLMLIRSVEYWIQDKPVRTSWTWISIGKIPKRVQQAVVVAEDARFLYHWGIDFVALDDVIDGASGSRRVRGASTITMQTVKNIYLWPGRSYVRKVIEGVMAPIAGVLWGKKRTLELYLNVIEWGEGIYGIEAASQHYYHKSVGALTREEAGSLAAILPSPRVLHPHRLSSLSRRRYLRIMREAPITPLP